MASQDFFHRCYGGRQSGLHHLSYMRTSKVYLALRLLEETGFQLDGKTVLDWGFGAGTFFLFCPKTCSIRGVEIEKETVREVSAKLELEGYRDVSLRQLDLADPGSAIAQLSGVDLILCSHVLEHVTSPVETIQMLAGALRNGGLLVCLVPINERFQDAHHEQEPTRELVEEWIAASGLERVLVREADPWIYPLQRFYVAETGVKHVMAQCFSLALGLCAKIIGVRGWARLSDALQGAGLKPVQCGFVLRKRRTPC